MAEQLGSTHKRTQQAFAALVRCYEAWDETEKANAVHSAAAQAGDIRSR